MGLKAIILNNSDVKNMTVLKIMQYFKTENHTV